jgi:hypothetical protein
LIGIARAIDCRAIDCLLYGEEDKSIDHKNYSFSRLYNGVHKHIRYVNFHARTACGSSSVAFSPVSLPFSMQHGYLKPQYAPLTITMGGHGGGYERVVA